MSSSIPADSRAYATVLGIMHPFLEHLRLTSSTADIIRTISNYLPFGIARSVELKFSTQPLEESVFDQQERVKHIAIDLIQNLITRLLSHHIYLREDVIRWYEFDPNHAKYFSPPEDEYITIKIEYQPRTTQRRVKLTKDQIMGMAYVMHSLRYRSSPTVTAVSSITNEPIDFNQLVHNAIEYQRRSDRFYQPYRVTILSDPELPPIAQADPTPVYFVHPEFMQGVISAAGWFKISENGFGSVWKDLVEMTTDGRTVPLKLDDG